MSEGGMTPEAPMAQSPESSGRRILTVFGDLNRGPRKVLRQADFVRTFSPLDWRTTDFAKGVEYALEMAWIETPSPNVYKLTEAGAAETR